jgi:CRP-like cAMP-binding protein
MQLSEFEALRPYLRFVPVVRGDWLQREHVKISAAYFINSGIASLIVRTGDGRSVEVGIAGREDMIGLP